MGINEYRQTFSGAGVCVMLFLIAMALFMMTGYLARIAKVLNKNNKEDDPDTWNLVVFVVGGIIAVFWFILKVV